MRLLKRHPRPPRQTATAADRRAAEAALRAIVAEAVIWQDAAEEVLLDIRDRRPLADVAPRGGPLVSRFVSLALRLPQSDDPEIGRYTSELRAVFDHHAYLIDSCLQMLAVDWRSPRIVEQLERIDGLGSPALRLEAVRAELLAAQQAREEQHAPEAQPAQAA
jgi:hypothetical protein